MRVVGIKYKLGKGQAPIALDSAQLLPGYGIEGSPANANKERELLLFPAGREADYPPDGLCPPRFFANLYIEKLDPALLAVGDLVRLGAAFVQVERLGKDCYAECPEFVRNGPCILARQTVCASVARAGMVAIGDVVTKIGEA